MGSFESTRLRRWSKIPDHPVLLGLDLAWRIIQLPNWIDTRGSGVVDADESFDPGGRRATQAEKRSGGLLEVKTTAREQ